MTYYLITDAGTQWFHYMVSKESDKLVDVFDMAPINCVKSTLLSNIYGREPVGSTMNTFLTFSDIRLDGHSLFGGWSISRLEFDRIKRLLELAPAVKEFNQIKDSV